MAVEGRVNSSQALNQDCQEVLANKQSKGLLRCRILSIVVAVITFIAGVVLIALTLASILTSVPYLALGVFLLLVTLGCIIFALCSEKIKKVPPTPISHKEEIIAWFEERKNIDMEKEKEDPEHFGRTATDIPMRSALDQFNHSCHHIHESPTLTETYRGHQDVLLFKDWCPVTLPDVTSEEEVLIRSVVGSYLLIEACVPKVSMLIDELHNKLKSPSERECLFIDKKTLQRKASFLFTQKDLATFFLAYTRVNDGHLAPFRAGAKWILIHYVRLRRQHNQNDFFTPGHSCYYARLAFNQTQRLYHQLFNVEKLRSIYANMEKDPLCHPWAFIPIYDLLKTEDHGDGFLEQQEDREYPSRAAQDQFWG
ncbi:hypothetical protein CPK_ORF00573 [Chlamydia pneumoniae LPCoLN]|uniref:hypothetical protein n=1 Tax=Chlamydia pneumoniae TaxID=83558 RepID=UPI0001BD9E0B|nr:hypothetical protein [Chlamydia pneumoniae]ACZ33043.1 hypothetical protein CPK_ORF00573 [Chlamydia pneumoniae LPCoLN]ETR79929.1 hypothetical protein X556_0730 [Chlamydia pneumoniae B21]